MRAYFICCHCDSCSGVKMGKFNIQQFVFLSPCRGGGWWGRRSSLEGQLLAVNEKCCWKIFENLSQGMRKRENVKHVYCHSLYSRELLRKVMKHFYTRLAPTCPLSFYSPLPDSPQLPWPPLVPAFGTLYMFLLLGQEKNNKTGELTVMRAKKNCAFAFSSSENNNFPMAIAIFPLNPPPGPVKR